MVVHQLSAAQTACFSPSRLMEGSLSDKDAAPVICRMEDVAARQRLSDSGNGYRRVIAALVSLEDVSARPIELDPMRHPGHRATVVVASRYRGDHSELNMDGEAAALFTANSAGFRRFVASFVYLPDHHLTEEAEKYRICGACLQRLSGHRSQMLAHATPRSNDGDMLAVICAAERIIEVVWHSELLPRPWR